MTKIKIKGRQTKKKQDDDVGNSSNEGMIELTSSFQSCSELEAYAAKYLANKERAKVIIKFEDNTELNLTTMLLKIKKCQGGR